jgi:CubicO group peptidase (beta-lactamase class C family)
LLSTAEDLVGSALLQPGILSAQSLKIMFRSQKTKAGEETGYGLGWEIAKSTSGQQIYEHSGGSVGSHSQLILYPSAHVVVALLTNLTAADWKREEVEAGVEKFAVEK